MIRKTQRKLSKTNSWIFYTRRYNSAMCGRTACTLAPVVICNACSYYDATAEKFRKPEWREHPPAKGTSTSYHPSPNHTPTMCSPVLIKVEQGTRVLQPMVWGLIPPWHKGEAKSHRLTTNNARLEGIESSKLYKRPLSQAKTCVVVCQGFYEWKSVGRTGTKSSPKEPYFIYMPQEDEKLKVYDEEEWNKGEWSEEKGWLGPRMLLMAGLYDTWKSPEGDVVYSYTVITMGSNSTLSWLHDRMPAILEGQEQVEAWISGSGNTSELLSLLKPAEKLRYYTVSTKVNNSRCQDADCMNPLVEKESKSKSLMENWLTKPGGSKKKEETDVKQETEKASSPNEPPEKKPKIQEPEPMNPK